MIKVITGCDHYHPTEAHQNLFLISMKSKKLFSEWFWLVVVWILITNIWTWLFLATQKGFVRLLDIEVLATENEMSNYWTSPYQYLEASIFGFLFGTLFFAINFFTDKYGLQKESFGRIILAKSNSFVNVGRLWNVQNGISISGFPVKENVAEEVSRSCTLHFAPEWLVSATASADSFRVM